MTDNSEEKSKSREQGFVEHVIDKIAMDTGYAARLKRADNPATEHYGYEALAPFADLQKDNQRMPYALVGAALCREKPQTDGTASLGEVLASCFAENKDQGNMRLRRLLSCDTPREACLVLRPLLALLQAKSNKRICYARLLEDLLRFSGKSGERVKQRWAMDFYSRAASASENEEGKNI